MRIGVGEIRTGRRLTTTKCPSKSSDLSQSRHLVVLLQVTELADDAVIVGKGNDSVNTLARICPRFDGRYPFGKDLRVKVLALLLPSIGLL